MANVTLTVEEAGAGTDVEVLGVGRQAAAASKSLTLSTEDKAVLDSLATKLDTAITALQIIDNMVLSAGTANIGDVDVLTINAVAPAFGSGAAGATVIRTLSATDDPVVSAINGTVAHSDVDAGNASKIGFKAVAGLSGVTLVSAADRTDAYAGLDGSLYVRTVPLPDIVSGNASNTDGTITTCIAASGDAAIKTYLSKVILTNMHASTVAYVEVKSGTTVKATIPCPPGGATVSFDPPLPPNAANEVWAFDPSAAVTTIYCSMVGFKSKV